MENKAFFEQLLNKPIDNKICTQCGFLRENEDTTICPQCGESFKGKDLTILDCLFLSENRVKRWKEKRFTAKDAFDVCVLFNSKLNALKKDFLKYCEEAVRDRVNSSQYLTRLNGKI